MSALLFLCFKHLDTWPPLTEDKYIFRMHSLSVTREMCTIGLPGNLLSNQPEPPFELTILKRVTVVAMGYQYYLRVQQYPAHCVWVPTPKPASVELAFMSNSTKLYHTLAPSYWRQLESSGATLVAPVPPDSWG